MAAPSFPKSGDFTPDQPGAPNASIAYIDPALKESYDSVMGNVMQQETSMLINSGILEFTPYEGYQHNKAVMGTIALKEITGIRNPTLQYQDYSIQDRVMRERRFTVSTVVDGVYDMKWLAANPEAAAIRSIKYAIAQTIDTTGVAAVVGDRLIKNADMSVENVSAADDGTVTINMTGGMTVNSLLKIPAMFSLYKAGFDAIRRAVVFMTGAEYYALLEDPRFVSYEYRGDRGLYNGEVMPLPGGMRAVVFPGGSNAAEGVTDATPVLPEKGTVRTNFAALPGALDAMIDVTLDVRPAREQGFIKGSIITADVRVAFMVTDPKKVVLFTTTIPQAVVGG